MSLSKETQALMPEESFDYYKKTNAMHCDSESPGGSKFMSAAEGGVDDIVGVIERMGEAELNRRIKERDDDRDALMTEGAPKNAFLPAEKTKDMPEGLPEALYYKVDGIKGRLGIIEISELDPGTKVRILQEKENAPMSFSAVVGKREDLPETSFATIIVGREPGSDDDQIWTIHPGAPIRPAIVEGVEHGFKHGDTVTVKDIIGAGLTAEDYIKLVPEE
jgi:hypothetical protein